MFVATANRKQLLAVMTNGGRESVVNVLPFEEGAKLDVGSEEVMLVWRDEPRAAGNLPNVILVEQRKVRDTLAWTATYLPDCRPITAFVRVTDAKTFSNAIKWQSAPSLGVVEGACLGLIVGETAAYTNRRIPASSLSPNACASTLSFALARALAVGYKGTEVHHLRDAWLAVRTITGQAELRAQPSVLNAPWSAIFALSSKDLSLPREYQEQLPKDVLTACFQCLEIGHVGTDMWQSLTKGLKYVADLIGSMDDSREERVKAFEKAVLEVLKRRSRKPVVEAFLIGYLASRISPGTLDHLDLLSRYALSMPEAFLWYGLLAGLSSRNGIQNFSGGLGRRVLRELLRRESILDRPRADIAEVELRVLSESHREDPGIRGSFPGYLDVELAPCVNSLVRLKGSKAATADRSSVEDLPAEELLEIITRLGRGLDELDFSYDRLATFLGLRRSARNRRRGD